MEREKENNRRKVSEVAEMSGTDDLDCNVSGGESVRFGGKPGALPPEEKAEGLEAVGVFQNWPGLTRTQATFLEAYAQLGMLTKAAQAAGCTTQMHYKALQCSQPYSEAYLEARRLAGNLVVEKMLQRVLEGERRYKFRSNGEPYVFPEGHEKAGQPYFETISDTIGEIYLTKALAGLCERSVIEHRSVQEKRLTVQVYLPDRNGSGNERLVAIESKPAPQVIEASAVPAEGAE